MHMFLSYLIWLLLALFYVVYLSCSGLHHIGGHAMLTLNTPDMTSLPLPPALDATAAPSHKLC